jgi:hypothetical protein
LTKYKSPGIDQISAELIQGGDEILRSEIRKLSNSIWNKKALSEQCKESISAPIHTKAGKTNCNNNRGISLLPTLYRILSNILFHT